MTTKLNENNISIVVNNGIQWQEIITAAGGSTNGVAGQGYLIDTTSNVHTINLPSSVEKGDTIAIKDYAGTFGTNGVTINRNGHNIQGESENSRIDTNRASVELVYVDSTKGWIYITESNVSVLGPTYISATGGTVTESGDFKYHTFTGDGCFVVSSVGNEAGSNTVDYLVVAGGGSGGSSGSVAGGGGGGGAGGYRESSGVASGCYTVSPLGACVSALPVSATTYPISVGGGGSSVSNPGTPPSVNGNDGSNSVFSTITSAGGGGGGRGLCAPETNYGAGRNGGSGGGAGSGGGSATGSASGGSGNSPPVAPPQGQPGGTTGPGNNIRGSSGGGGALNAGGSTSTCNNAGDGGNGATSSINATPTVRAGGGGGSTNGGGGSPTTGCGGAGGGGHGGTDGTDDAVSGTANTGGGGGGASDTYGYTSGAGGKGIVIIRYKFQ